MYVRTWLKEASEDEARKNPVAAVSMGRSSIDRNDLAVTVAGGHGPIIEIRLNPEELTEFIQNLTNLRTRFVDKTKPPTIRYEEF